ncbi:hypothetical protein TI06_23040, partial [Vibrio vulnificus]
PGKGGRGRSGVLLEEAQRVDVVAHQQVLGLLVVVEHHLLRLATDAGLLVAAERGVGRVQVVAVGPHATGLDPVVLLFFLIDAAPPEAAPVSLPAVVGT